MNPLTEATRLSLDGQHSEAGCLLERLAGTLQREERYRTFFLAATQFFLAGDYDEAFRLTNRIRPSFLPGREAQFAEFVRDVRAKREAKR